MESYLQYLTEDAVADAILAGLLLKKVAIKKLIYIAKKFCSY